MSTSPPQKKKNTQHMTYTSSVGQGDECHFATSSALGHSEFLGLIVSSAREQSGGALGSWVVWSGRGPSWVAGSFIMVVWGERWFGVFFEEKPWKNTEKNMGKHGKTWQNKEEREESQWEKNIYNMRKKTESWDFWSLEISEDGKKTASRGDRQDVSKDHDRLKMI